MHDYLSTACAHGLHPRCRLSCKFCATPCRCECHGTGKIEPVRLDVYVHFDPEPPDPRIGQILTAVRTLTTQGAAMAMNLDTLTAAVTRNGDVQASAVTLIQQIAQAILDAPADAAKVTELANALNAQADALAAAVVANTPQAPPADPPVDPPQ